MKSNPDLSKTETRGLEVDSTAPGASSSGFVELPESVRALLPERDPEALHAFYEAYFDRLYGFIRRMVRQEQLAEDLTQDVFMHLHKNFDAYDATRPLRPWVFTIATNKVRDYWRSKKHQTVMREVHIEDDERGGFAISRSDAPDAKLQREEAAAAVADAIQQLPESMKSTLILRYYEGLSFEAIGEIIDRNEAAVRKRYSRALEELRQLLAATQGPQAGGAA